MSVQQKRVASLILKEQYGEVVEKVGSYCVGKGPRPLRDIIRDTKLPRDQVQKALCCLIQHHFVTFEVNKKNVTLYNAWIANILLRPRAPRYIYCAKTLFGYTGELITDEILQHGAVAMSSVISKVMSHLAEDDPDADDYEVKATFADLVENRFLQRVKPVHNNEDNVDMNSYNEDDLYALPPGMTLQGVVEKSINFVMYLCTIQSHRVGRWGRRVQGWGAGGDVALPLLGLMVEGLLCTDGLQPNQIKSRVVL